MNYKLVVTYILISSILLSCKYKDNKAEETPPAEILRDSATQEKIPEINTPSGTTRGLDNNADILANIDKYLVSTPNYQPPSTPNTGINHATVIVLNELPSITIQKALVEVSILLDDGKEYRTDYYNIINIEPGESKSFKIPVSARGNKIISRIVKLKSTELTNGEMILVGDRYVPH